jgi:hypothetical protein
MCYNVFVTSARFFRAFPAMAPRQAVLLTPSISSLRLIQGVSSAQITHETPQIRFFVFKSLRTLSFSVSCKSCVCHSYANCRDVYQQFPFWHSPFARYSNLSLFTLLRTLLHSPKNQPFSFQTLPDSLAKTPGGGRGSIGRLNRNTRKGQEIGPGWRIGLPDPFGWQRIKRRGAACGAS